MHNLAELLIAREDHAAAKDLQEQILSVLKQRDKASPASESPPTPPANTVPPAMKELTPFESVREAVRNDVHQPLVTYATRRKKKT